MKLQTLCRFYHTADLIAGEQNPKLHESIGMFLGPMIVELPRTIIGFAPLVARWHG
jgi:hypothetical protein